MKALVVGGTGALGGHAAIYMHEKGHDVTIAARNDAPQGTPMADIPFLQGDYVAGDFTPDKLTGFDWIIFAAGNDPRHLPPEGKPEDIGEHFRKANDEAVPAFTRAARNAGVKRMVQLGSYYAQAAPQLVDGNRYIQSRLAACAGARAEATADFAVMSINAPFMVGRVSGLPSMIFDPYVQWAQGKLPIPHFGPAGGSNFMSFRSLSEALLGALENGESGKAYLVGDQNLSFTEYFQMFFDAVGNDVKLEERDDEHPLLPDIAIPQGRGNWVRYDADETERAALRYRKDDVLNAVRDAAEQFGG